MNSRMIPTPDSSRIQAGTPHRTWAYAAALSLALASTACTTTGDPTQGGLFGWSQEKALERQSDLSKRSDAATRDAADAKRKTEALNQQRESLAADAARLQKELDRLLAENTDLDTRLRTLMRRQDLGASELARLQQVVAENERVRRNWAAQTQAQAQAPNAARKPLTNVQLDGVSEQNSRLHREVMILMQR